MLLGGPTVGGNAFSTSLMAHHAGVLGAPGEFGLAGCPASQEDCTVRHTRPAWEEVQTQICSTVPAERMLPTTVLQATGPSRGHLWLNLTAVGT